MKYNEKKSVINRGVKQQYKYKLGSIQTLHHLLRGYQSGHVFTHEIWDRSVLRSVLRLSQRHLCHLASLVTAHDPGSIFMRKTCPLW